MKRFALPLILVLSLVLCPLFTLAQGESGALPAAVPSLVDDQAGVISVETIERIEQQGAILRDLTGAEIMIATVDFLGGVEISDYAKKLFDARQLGAKNNNGVLLLLCTKQEDYYLLAGQGFGDGFSSTELLARLDQWVEPDFAVGAYDDAAKKAFDAIKTEVETRYSVSVEQEISRREALAAMPPEPDYGWLWAALPIVFFALACLMFLLYFIGRRPRRRNG